MGFLPVSASDYFKDFSFDVLNYNVMENGSLTGTYRGLSNTDEDGQYIGFLVEDQPVIHVGNIIYSANDVTDFRIRRISYDHYNGKPELLKAYY